MCINTYTEPLYNPLIMRSFDPGSHESAWRHSCTLLKHCSLVQRGLTDESGMEPSCQSLEARQVEATSHYNQYHKCQNVPRNGASSSSHPGAILARSSTGLRTKAAPALKRRSQSPGSQHLQEAHAGFEDQVHAVETLQLLLVLLQPRAEGAYRCCRSC